MKKIILIATTLVLLALQSGCTNPLNSQIKNIQLAILLNIDAELTLEDVQKSEVDLALIKSGDRPVAVIARAFTEFGKEKWISEDQAMLVIKDHRVIRTVGFENDLLAVLTGEKDPLSDVSGINNKTWYWEVDWEVGEYGYSVNSHFSVNNDNLEIFGKTFSTLHITEQLAYEKAQGIFQNSSWENHYWVDKDSGVLLKTSQQSAPFSDRFVITFASNAVRLM